MKKVIVAIVMAGVAGQVSAQGILGKANDFLGRLNTSMHGAAGGPVSRSAPLAVNQQSAEQQAGQAQALATPVQAQIAADRTEAKPLIEKIVTISACATNDTAWNALNRYAEHPTSWSSNINEVSLIPWTKYHPKNRCLDVLRITNWQKPAKNALSFKVYLISAQSDEAKEQSFTLIKADDGEWMVRSIGQA